VNLNRILIVFISLQFAGAVLAASTNDVQTVTIGYAEIVDDPRYDEKRAYARIRVKPHDRPVAGAEIAIRDSRIFARALNMNFELKRIEAENTEDLVEQIKYMNKNLGMQFFIIDADTEVLSFSAKATAEMNILLFNISESSDELRGLKCQAQLMHVIPSYAMLTDALGQFLVFKKWRKVLLLKGPEIGDAAFAAAFTRSAKRFGINIDTVRDFVPGNDPRERDQNNITLMTSGSDAELVFISDIEGEFGRYVQYQTKNPLPVLGTEGLQAASWHWAWERHGAPQLNQRFERHAKRRMQGPDWAAWAAVKSIIESVLRTKSTKFETVSAYLRSDRLNLDAYKGTPVSYRSWDNQLRQPVLLHTYNAVTDRAPVRGFLHPTENMDSLGYDQAETRCQF
jgi:ABC transporter substrate binding protein (PQQ-dependent alcohol dehydrogenase system)